jgi:hypothetical protein
MLKLAVKTCKVATLLVLFIAVPLWAELENVLKLWLREVPPHTSSLCKFVLASFLVDRITIGFMIAVNARGKVAAYQATLGFLLIASLPIAWFMLSVGVGPSGVGVAILLSSLLCSAGRIAWVRKMFGVSVVMWVKEVFIPCASVGSVSLAAATLVTISLPETTGRFMLTVLAGCSVWAVSVWIFALGGDERASIRTTLSSAQSKLGNLLHGDFLS